MSNAANKVTVMTRSKMRGKGNLKPAAAVADAAIGATTIAATMAKPKAAPKVNRKDPLLEAPEALSRRGELGLGDTAEPRLTMPDTEGLDQGGICKAHS
jgi:hypothetical protein